MRLIAIMALIALLAACGGPGSKRPQTKQGEAQRHVLMITERADDTPGNSSLIQTALDESEIAARHAQLAALKPTDLIWMQQHAAHVGHAVNPVPKSEGPGKGYGVRRATEQIMEHMNLAAASPDATVNIKGESVRIHRSSKNVLGRCDTIEQLVVQIGSAGSAGAAASLVDKLRTTAEQLAQGVDKNGDGLVTWRRGEGGLATIREHLHYLR